MHQPHAFQPAGEPNARRRGAVAVVARDERLLVIRRSRWVAAPRTFCFPGGGIEGRESEQAALVREFAEELGASIAPVRRLWQSTTSRGVELAWWLARLPGDAPLRPNPAEVESIHWFTLPEMSALEELLESNHEFLAALAGGAFQLDWS